MPDEVDIETLGGLAGFGGRLRRFGTIDLERLSPNTREQVDLLFQAKGKAVAEGAADTLLYRLTRTVAGETATIEVDETDLPAELTQDLEISVGPTPTWPSKED